MNISSIHPMAHHLPNLSVDLFGIEFPVPEPERPNAVSAIWVLKSRMKRLQGMRRQRSGREGSQLAKIDSTNAGASYSEKIPSCDLAHGRRSILQFCGSRKKVKK